MSVYSIYKVTNLINGKVYIGFTSNYEKRIHRHKINSNFRKQKFYNSIKKYGFDKFIFELVYQSLDYEHCKNEMEPYFITEYDSYNSGYNSTLGGEGCIGYTHTKEVKDILSLIMKNKIGSNNPFYGKNHKDETILRNKQKNIEILTNLKGKKVCQYSINGDLINIHDSIRSAARSIKKSHPSIVKCCKGELEHAHGFVWRYNIVDIKVEKENKI